MQRSNTPADQIITQIVEISPTNRASDSRIDEFSPTMVQTIANATSTPAPVTLVGAGDISICGQDGDDLTAHILDRIPGTVFTAGDNSNEEGTLSQYESCFGPSWGRHLDRLYPSPGNHDYVTDSGKDYFSYFGERAGEPGRDFYAYRLGNWLVLSLDGNCETIGCGANSAQVKWLEQTLGDNETRCTLAYWHQPRWSSGTTQGNGSVSILWKTLYRNGVDVVINGDDHIYERFAPMDGEGHRDDERGMREFIVGTGGAYYGGFGEEIHSASEVRRSGIFGVLLLTLFPARYQWEFIPVEGQVFSDRGGDICR